MSADMAHHMARLRRESIRWYLLTALNVSRPAGAGTTILLSVIQSTYLDATEHEIKRELDYLRDRKLVVIEVDPMERWHAELTHYGVDVAEYTITCEAGIARPRFGS